MSWNEGYVTDLEYITEYTHELNPLTLELALLANGYQALHKHPLRYLELGFGQGMSLNIHAAACDGEFWGNDFNPSHTVNAKIMAQTSGANVTIFDDSFAELAARKDLPEFDVIVMHGVWTWVSAENQKIILDIVRSKLALGGILYVSYNTLSGWSAAVPIRQLITLHSEQVSAPGTDRMKKVEAAMDFTQRLIDIEAGYFVSTPAASHHFDHMKKGDPAYLVHEYYNNSWSLTSFNEVSKCLANNNVTFVGDALINTIFYDELLPANIKSLFADIKDPIFYNSVRDFCFSRMFRRDIWIKGGRTLTNLQRLQCIAQMRFTLLDKPDSESLAISSSVGNIPLDEAAARIVMEVLAQNNYEPKTVNELLGYPQLQHLSLSQACDTILRLCGRYVSPANDDETIEKLKSRTDKLNDYLIDQAQHSGEGKFLASPVTGGGVFVPAINQLFLLAIKNGFTLQDDVVAFVWKILSSLGHSMSLPDGKLCSGARENFDAITVSVKPFFETRLPILKALKVA